MDYLKLPLRFGQFFQQGRLDRCGMQESIARNLHLLITTAQGENKQDLEYGSAFWNNDYDIHLNNEDRRMLVTKSLQEQIAQHEKRLEQVRIEVIVRQAPLPKINGGPLRHRIEIIVQARLVHSKEPFTFKTGFFIGPLLLD
ncbi:MAG TPA: GPW/gp25 family protein [Phnomibacter sp.]|nr:GPW/gp25 family protein [Phnomibacter sp.]